jgi:hypothetical protein
MVMVVGMIAALVLGFVTGRVWQIRQQLIKAEDLGDRRRKSDKSVQIEGSGELDLIDPDLMETLDRDIRNLVISTVSARRRHRSPRASFYALPPELTLS